MKNLSSYTHFLIIPIILIGSDLLIAFNAHYSGATGNIYTWAKFTEYLSELTWGDLAPTLIVAFVVVFLIHYFIKRGG